MTLPPHRFAIATRDELWILGKRTTLVDARLSYGRADTNGDEIDARDERDGELLAACEAEAARLRELLPRIGEGRVRLVADARTNGVSSTIIVSSGARSIVTSPMHLEEDLALLRATRDGEGEIAYRELPLVWRNGSAAVLLHEAVGHAAEHGHFEAAWPEWLRVSDEPLQSIDDAGVATRAANLLAESPQALRRESFRDVPLARMSRLVVANGPEQHPVIPSASRSTSSKAAPTIRSRARSPSPSPPRSGSMAIAASLSRRSRSPNRAMRSRARSLRPKGRCCAIRAWSARAKGRRSSSALTRR